MLEVIVPYWNHGDGTAVCKGDSTSERPHRLSRILEAPELFDREPYLKEKS